MTQTSDPRPPMSPGDWSALGLRSGRCLVGAVSYVTAEAVHLRLVSALTGELMEELAVVRWADVQRYVVIPASAFETDRDGYEAVPIDDLWHFQTRWQARSKDRQRHTDELADDDEVLISGTSGRTYPWRSPASRSPRQPQSTASTCAARRRASTDEHRPRPR